MSRDISTIREDDFSGFKPDIIFLFDPSVKNDYVKYMRLHEDCGLITETADDILAHIFNILGSGDRFLGFEIPWNKDFKASFIWENDYYKNIKIVDLGNESDVKIPWELSRFQHVFELGKAYWLTDRREYADELANQIESWIKHNPYEHSVNWFCAMDVAIRACNLIAGYYFFKEALDEDFLNRLGKLLYLHGLFIMDNLENVQLTSNHYISDLVGLLFLGLYFKTHGRTYFADSNPDIWLGYSISELETEMQKQVSADGTAYEASTSYHRLDTELFTYAALICRNNGIELSEAFDDRLQKMYEFISGITKPNGLAPLIGDADDGRLFIPGRYACWDRRDFRHLLPIAGQYFGRDDFRIEGALFEADAVWTCRELRANPPVINSAAKPLKRSIAFCDGGYYIMRNERVYICITTGELSFHGLGCHSHNDQLGVEVNLLGEDFITDPGVYVYTASAELRNHFRSTAVHSTVYVEGFEQNDFEDELFALKDQCFGRCVYFNASNVLKDCNDFNESNNGSFNGDSGNGLDEELFEGIHSGFEKKCGIIHKRSVRLLDTGLEIKDRFEGKRPENRVFINFALDHGVGCVVENDEIVLKKNGVTARMLIGKGINIQIKPALTSYSYGTVLSSKKIVLGPMPDCESLIRIHI